MEVNTMASMMAIFREGHLSEAFQMFSFLKSKQNGVAVFDSAEPETDETQFLTENWCETPYVHCKKTVPSNAPAPGSM